MRYEINVSRNGRHLFATTKRSLTDERKAIELARELAEWFTDCDISVTRWEETGRQIEWRAPEEEPELPLPGAKAEPPVTFTKLETKVLQALIDGLYAEPGFSDVDAKDLSVATGIGIQTVGGVLTALTKKDILFVEELSPRTGHLGLGENGEGVSIIYLTEKGEKFHPRWAEENGTEWFPIITRED